jgi:hypothetical protein
MVEPAPWGAPKLPPEPEPLRWAPEPEPAPEPARWAAAAPPEPEPIIWAPPKPTDPEPPRWDTLPPAEPAPARWSPDAVEPEPTSWTPEASEPEPVRWTPEAAEPEPTRWTPEAFQPEAPRWEPAPAEEPEAEAMRWPPLPEEPVEAEPVRWTEDKNGWSPAGDDKNPFEEFAYEKKGRKNYDVPGSSGRKEPEWQAMPPEPGLDPRKLFQDPDSDNGTVLPGFLSYGDDRENDISEKFAALVTLDQGGKALMREPEPPLYEGETNQTAIKLVVILLVLLMVMAAAVVEHKLIMHFLPASARFFNMLGLK